jgi:hypothetical protein
LVNSRPAQSGNNAVLLHFRELDGSPADISVSSAIAGRPVRTVSIVNAMGKKVATASNSIHFNPFEVKFIELGF